MEKVFENKTAIITSGSKGIGREIARLLGIYGCRMVISGRDKPALDHIADNYNQEEI